MRAAAALTPSGSLLALRPLGIFDLQSCLRGWAPCAAPLIVSDLGATPAVELQLSPLGARLVFGAAALAVAVAADGHAVAVWEAGPSCDRRTGTCRQADGDGAAVYLRPLGANGRPGPLLRLAAVVAGDQARPAVAAAPGGAFVALWQSRGQDGSGWGVYGRRSGPGLDQLGDEFRIAPGTLGDQQAPAVALAGRGGGFLAAWQGELGGHPPVLRCPLEHPGGDPPGAGHRLPRPPADSARSRLSRSPARAETSSAPTQKLCKAQPSGTSTSRSSWASRPRSSRQPSSSRTWRSR